MEQNWTSRFTEKAVSIAEGVAKGFHAIPKPNENPFKAAPSMHRLMNVVGMVGGFASVQYLSNIMFACKINGSQCEELPKEKVPAPLRFLHGIFEYNPFSDAPRDQWMKVAHQMLPAIGGAMGAMKGSEMFFTKLNGRENDYHKWRSSPQLDPIKADAAASYVQGKAWRTLAGATAWLSSASGLTVFYGVALNSAFKLCNGAKVAGWLRKLSNNHSDLGYGPQKGIDEVLKTTKTMMNDVASSPARESEITEAFGKRLLGNMEQFGKLTDEQKLKIVNKLQAVMKEHAKDADPKKLAEELNATVVDILKHTDIKDFKIADNGPVGNVMNKWPGVQKAMDDIVSRMHRSPDSGYLGKA